MRGAASSSFGTRRDSVLDSEQGLQTSLIVRPRIAVVQPAGAAQVISSVSRATRRAFAWTPQTAHVARNVPPVRRVKASTLAGEASVETAPCGDS